MGLFGLISIQESPIEIVISYGSESGTWQLMLVAWVEPAGLQSTLTVHKQWSTTLEEDRKKEGKIVNRVQGKEVKTGVQT